MNDKHLRKAEQRILSCAVGRGLRLRPAEVIALAKSITSRRLRGIKTALDAKRAKRQRRVKPRQDDGFVRTGSAGPDPDSAAADGYYSDLEAWEGVFDDNGFDHD